MNRKSQRKKELKTEEDLVRVLVFEGSPEGRRVYMVGKRKGFPYPLPSVGPGADSGVQAVSQQVTVSHTPGGRLPLLCQACGYLPSRRASPLLGRYQVILLGDRST